MATEVVRGTTKASVNATGAVYTGSCRLLKFVVTTLPTGGVVTIKDGASGDVVYNSASVVLGTVVELDMPMDTSINVSALGASGVIEVLYSKHKGA